jgi:hypothetical protein
VVKVLGHPNTSFTSRPLFPMKRAPVKHSVSGWAGLRTVLDDLEKRTIYWPCHESNHDS